MFQPQPTPFHQFSFSYEQDSGFSCNNLNLDYASPQTPGLNQGFGGFNQPLPTPGAAPLTVGATPATAGEAGAPTQFISCAAAAGARTASTTVAAPATAAPPEPQPQPSARGGARGARAARRRQRGRRRAEYNRLQVPVRLTSGAIVNLNLDAAPGQPSLPRVPHHEQPIELSPASSAAVLSSIPPPTTPSFPRPRNSSAPRQHGGGRVAFEMEAAGEQEAAHSMTAQQAAAKDYQPDLVGPLVADKISSDTLAQEYATADPIYIEKTTALAQTYSHYRRIQGDGNCGWRAIGFAYFEKLVESGDQGQVEGEVARLISYNQLLAEIGGYTYFEDFCDEFLGLLRDVAANMANPAIAHALVLQRWNSQDATNAIIYYLRLLAATYLKANAETYDPFVPDTQGIHGFCMQTIEPVNREIEHLGILALVNILLQPVGVVLEIAYLDRSEGDQVNKYRFPEEANGRPAESLGPMAHLLYRPDHYDILYQESPMQQPPLAPVAPATMQVHRVDGFSHNIQVTETPAGFGNYSSIDFNPLAMIPGYDHSSSLMPPLPPTTSAAIAHQFETTQHGHWVAPFQDDIQQAMMAAPLGPQTPTTPISPNSSLGAGPALVGNPAGNPVPPVVPAVSMPTDGLCFRFSPEQFRYNDQDGAQPPLPPSNQQPTSNAFKNSIWNRSHFGNPDFHPEEYNPHPSPKRRDGRGPRRKNS